jgi:tetratricopeptide (TPR) repeat protein
MPASPPHRAASHERASDWMHRGIDLLNANSPTGLEEAVRCFDQAIALRRALPSAENPRDRYLLAGGWLNRGDALALLGGDTHLADALQSYDEALALLRALPLDEDPLYPRRLAIAWINRGNASTSAPEALRCFREALTVLDDSPAAAIADLPRLRAGALVNLAGAMLNVSDPSASEARNLASRAISLLRKTERDETSAAETSLHARHIFCRAIAAESRDGQTLPPEFFATATQAVDEGLALARHWAARGDGQFCAWAEDLFRFGCLLYQTGPAHFLAEFIRENLVPEKAAGALPLNRETHAAAVAALWHALNEIQRDGLDSFSTPRFKEVLENLRDLRVTEERLDRLRRAATA